MSPKPAPSAVIRFLISSLARILSARAFSTLRILPRSGRMAWLRRSRPCLAEPPALSPSTMKSSQCSGSRSLQSASLPGRVAELEEGLALDQLAGPGGGLARPGRGERLLDDPFGLGGVLLEVLHQRVAQDRGHLSGDLAVAELGLGLALELRFLELDADHRGEPVPDVVPAEVGVVLLQDPGLARVLVEGRGQRGTEAGQVRATLLGVDVVGIGQHVLGEGAVLVLDSYLHHVAVDLALHVHGPGVDDVAVGVEVAHEGPDAALEVEGVAKIADLVVEGEADPLGQEGELAQPVGHRLPVVGPVGEDLGVRPPADRGAALRGAPDGLHRSLGEAPAVALAVQGAVLVDLGDQPLAQGVDHRGAHPVEPAGDLVTTAPKLAPGVQLGQHHLQTDLLLGGVHVHRDAPPVVHDRHRAVLVQGDQDGVAVAGHGLVDRVVDDLVDQMVQTAKVGGADVHPRPPTHRLQPLEGHELGRGIGVPAPAAAGCGLVAVGEFAGYRGRGLGQLRFLSTVACDHAKPIAGRGQQPRGWRRRWARTAAC